jgi:hypothetical protein
MKSFRIQFAVVSAIAVAALAMLYFQQQTIKDLRQQIAELTQQAAQVAPLQEQLASAAQAAAASAPAQAEQTREMARLRNDASRLRTVTNELAKAKQDIQSLTQRLAAETEAKRGVMADAKAATQILQAETQRVADQNACINNLRLIDGAKQQWALENKKQITDTPTWDDLRPYIGRGPNGELPTCPDGGVYTIGTVGEKPTCNVPGHVLP